MAPSRGTGPTSAGRRDIRWTLKRIRRHASWVRTQGLGRLIEEDDLDPVARTRNAVAKWRWRRSHGVPAGTARAVFLVGVQRSGTNMLVRGLERAPEVEVRNENDSDAFHRFQLRSDDVVAGLVKGSRHQIVLFKPLCDSHRLPHLLDDLGLAAPAGLWAYRDVEGRVRSALAKFGTANLEALQQIVATGGEGMWQARGLTGDDVEELRSLDPSTMSPATACACFWWLRNRIFFRLQLDQRQDVLLTSYQRFLDDPEASMRRVCEHLAFPYRPELIAHVERRASPTRAAIDIALPVRRRCDELSEQLAAASG
jgi:hypothetical protein